MSKIKVYIFACLFVFTAFVFSFAQDQGKGDIDFNAMKQAISEQSKQIQEMAKNMTPEQKAEFNRQIKQNIEEQKAKMKAAIDSLTPEEKAQYEKYLKEMVKEIEVK